MNKYLHATQDYSLKTGSIIKPRVPYTIGNEEDDTTPRFCISKTPEGCLTSVVWGLHYLKIGDTFRILEIDLDSYDKENIVYPSELVKRNLVSDAEICGETWIINSDVKIIGHRDVILTKMKTDVCSFEGCDTYYYLIHVELKEINSNEMVAVN